MGVESVYHRRVPRKSLFISRGGRFYDHLYNENLPCGQGGPHCVKRAGHDAVDLAPPKRSSTPFQSELENATR